MLTKKTITLSLLALLLVMSFASCASDTTSDAPVPANESKSYLQIQVNVDGGAGSHASRADDNTFTDNPAGGEDGDGDDKGEEYERTVTNLNLLLYSSAKNDMTDDQAKIEQVIYFEHFSSVSGGSSGVSWTSGTREIPHSLVPQNYHMLVVANAGNMTSNWKGRTLKEVRDQLMQKVCNRNEQDIMKSTDFLMSSLADAQLTPGGHTGSFEDPYQVNINIERLAARIDILPNALYKYDKPTNTYTYNYNVKAADGTLLGGFVLEAVMPYNDVTSGEYLIKRVTNLTDQNSVNYNSKETADAAYHSTNYVICPWSKDRNTVSYRHGKKTIAEWEAVTFSDFYRTKKADKTHGADNNNGKATAPYYLKYYILDYVMENTSFDNSEETATGLVFKGTYYAADQWEVASAAEQANGTYGKPKDGATGTPKCYTYIIRHSDPSGTGTTSDPMHYGIVRNNIYRIKIEGVQGDGPEGLKLTVNVRKWATYKHEEASM